MPRMDEPVRLTDGTEVVTEVVRQGGVVRRGAGSWSPAVHALLGHLERIGFDGAPRPVALEGASEVLTFIEGTCPSVPWEPWVFSDEVLAGVADLLRRYHAVVADFDPPRGARWRRWVGATGAGPIVCHADLWPANVVCRAGVPVALIDFDFAQPGQPLDDVASAAKHWVPLVAAGRRAVDGWPEPGDEPRRLRLLCDEYGLDDADRRGLLSAVLAMNHRGYDSHRLWAAQGVAGFVEMWANGSGQRILDDRAWLLAQWDRLQAAL